MIADLEIDPHQFPGRSLWETLVEAAEKNGVKSNWESWSEVPIELKGAYSRAAFTWAARLGVVVT